LRCCLKQRQLRRGAEGPQRPGTSLPCQHWLPRHCSSHPCNSASLLACLYV
jgi:hypothetical protein